MELVIPDGARVYIVTGAPAGPETLALPGMAAPTAAATPPRRILLKSCGVAALAGLAFVAGGRMAGHASPQLALAARPPVLGKPHAFPAAPLDTVPPPPGSAGTGPDAAAIRAAAPATAAGGASARPEAGGHARQPIRPAGLV